VRALVDVLLRQCPGLRVVATSREALGVTAETAWLVPSLSLPSVDGASPEDSEPFSCSWTAHGRTARLELSGEHRASVGRSVVGSTVSRSPAGACGARLRVLSPEQIASRLDAGFVSSRREIAPRSRGTRPSRSNRRELQPSSSRASDCCWRDCAVFGGRFTLERRRRSAPEARIAPTCARPRLRAPSRNRSSRCASTGVAALSAARDRASVWGERLPNSARPTHGSGGLRVLLRARGPRPNQTSRRRAAACGSNDCRRSWTTSDRPLAWSREGDAELHNAARGSPALVRLCDWSVARKRGSG